jgi:hypothetical protein
MFPSGNHSRTLRTAVVTGHAPGNKPGRYGPIRTGTADLIVVLLKGEDHRANPEALRHVGHGVLHLDSGLSSLIPLERRGKRILG